MTYQTLENIIDIATAYNFNATIGVILIIPFVLFIGAMLKRGL